MKTLSTLSIAATLIAAPLVSAMAEDHTANKKTVTIAAEPAPQNGEAGPYSGAVF